jgi:hypothetical protein
MAGFYFVVLANTDRHNQKFMQAAKYNEWDFYPVNLKPEEVKDPLLVLTAFFYDDWLPGHLERLKQWRDCVLTDDYYRDMKNSPAGLLTFYKLNICLVEAAYLLKDARSIPNIRQKFENITAEQNAWRDYPANLLYSELLDPYLVLNDFFIAYNLPQYREQLYEWLEYGLSSKAANEFIETIDLVKVYENLQRLYSAAWLIRQRTSEEPYLKEPDIAILPVDLTQPARLYKLNPIIEAGRQEQISKIISVIKHQMPSVQAVFYLGIAPGNPDKIYLLFFTANDEPRQAQSLSSMIEESCQDIAGIIALVHHASSLYTGLANGHSFFNKALSCPVVYLSGDMMLPVAGTSGNYTVSEHSVFNWERWHNQGKDFLSGAAYYLGIKAYNAALFSLHQCAECLLIAVIRAVLGYRVNNHNLSRLLKITEMFTGDLAEIFNLTDKEDAALFDLLKH